MVVDRHLKARMDHRTIEEMGTDVEQFTIKEFYWGMALRYEFIARGYPCSVEEHGVDNTGSLILGRLPNDNVDKKINFTDGSPSMLFEIKAAPDWCNDFHTLKKYTVESCLRQRAFFFVPQTFRYFMYGNEALKAVQDNYRLIKPRKWGSKPCWRPDMEFIMELVEKKLVLLRNWTPEALEYIERFKDILTEERRTDSIAAV